MTTTEPRLAQPPAVAEPEPGPSIRPRLRHDALFADTGDGFVLRGRTAAQLIYVAHYVNDATRRFLDFRSTRVLGAGTTGRAGVLGMLHNGLEQLTQAHQLGAQLGAMIGNLLACRAVRRDPHQPWAAQRDRDGW